MIRFCVVLVMIASINVHGESQFRLKFGTDLSVLNSEHYWQQILDRGYSFNNQLNLRFMVNGNVGRWKWDVHGTVQTAVGDKFKLNYFGLVPTEQEAEHSGTYWDLTADLDGGSRHRVSTTIDRLNISYQGDLWRFTAGRFPTTWGRGIVFHPHDVYNSYQPLAVDRMYKQSNDAILLEKIFENNWELHALAVARNNELSSSKALRLYVPIEAVELDLIVANNYEDTVSGFSLALPINEFILRLDYARTCPGKKDCHVSGILNLDLSFNVLEVPAYVFAEYYHHTIGLDRKVANWVNIGAALEERLQRGEIFTVAQDSLALGGLVNWHPLWSQSFTYIANLNDASRMCQSYVSYTLTDSLSFHAGVQVPSGKTNTEYGKKLIDPTFQTHIGGQTIMFFEFYYFR